MQENPYQKQLNIANRQHNQHSPSSNSSRQANVRNELTIETNELRTQLFNSPASHNPFNYGQLHHNINPDCPICLKPVFWSRHLFSGNRAWHVQCFTCSYCYKVSCKNYNLNS